MNDISEKRGANISGSETNNSRASWEQRGRHFGASLRGVLFKNFPELLNEHMHQWHVRAICKFLELEKPASLLDVGCGYGRLSAAVREKFPKIDTVGVDISAHYAGLYQQNLKRPAFVASIEDLPDTLGQFDCILAVTVLMYVSPDKLLPAAAQLMKHLKPRGTLIIIENHCSGSMFQNPFGLKDIIVHPVPGEEIATGGRCFKQQEIRCLIEQSKGRIVGELRMPLTTLLIIPLYIMVKLFPKSFCQTFLKFISSGDKCFGKFHLPSIHVAWLIRRI